jgi:hypothetical protein
MQLGAPGRAARGRRSPRGARVAGHPEADPPGALADVELAEAACAELGGKGRQQFIGEPVDRGMGGTALVGRALRRARGDVVARAFRPGVVVVRHP